MINVIIGTRQLLQNNLRLEPKFFWVNHYTSSCSQRFTINNDSHLTYDQHIAEVVSSCMPRLSQIDWARKCFTKETLSLLMPALVMNKLLYCSSVWSNTSAKKINKLQSLKNVLAGSWQILKSSITSHRNCMS